MAESNFDRLWESVAEAVKDVREKVVEEPWFGRALTEPGAREWPQAHEPQQQSMEPQGLTGEILPPESTASHNAPSVPLIEHGTVLDNQAPHWPEAKESTQHRDALEQSRDRDIDIDR